MEQPTKLIIVGTVGASQAHTYEDFLYKCAYGMFPQERSEYLDLCIANHLSMSKLRANIKSCLGLIKSQQLVSLGVLKFFYPIQAIGFFGFTKVNLRNAP